jgi:hypothetical protein
MKITKVAPPINGGAIWSGEAVSDRQHYFWMADQGGKGCQAQSGRLEERGHVRNGVRYSGFYKSLRRAPAALALPVLKAVRAAQS